MIKWMMITTILYDERPFMELATETAIHGFTFETREDLPEIEGAAYVGRHEASGARLLYLANGDSNKSFAIGFRTPPKDDTGVFHILEHSVLCGSRRFPVKEPFVDLLKSSMQTFLNAMTFADKTLYPVASTNEQDLFNLMDVYLDAVFHPNIYEKRQIFEQEGWHYELHAADGSNANPADLPANSTTLTYNGVVYNEMKGALSDATSVLYDEVQAGLFPNTCYAFESGGTPQAIPTLTYEEYLDEHRRHYRTDNSYIILYGNIDIDRALAFLDERYLTPVAAEQRERDDERARTGLGPLLPREITIPDEPSVYVKLPQLSDRCGGSRDEELIVPLPHGAKVPEDAELVQPPALFTRKTMDTAPENACAACGFVIGDPHDRVRAMAVEILLDALFGSNEAPLKRALLNRGVAHDVDAFVSDALARPFAVVQLSMPAEGAGEALAQIVADETRALLDAGLDKKLVEAALAHAEFTMREHDMGYADGVIYAMMSLSTWLYDDNAPMDYLRYERAFAQLRQALAGNYFEQLCVDLFLQNPHRAAAEIVPTPGKSDDDSAKKLETMKQELSAEERTRIVEEEALLRHLQEAPDTPEAVATLPRLSVADIGGAPDEPGYGMVQDAPAPCLRHQVPTRGITYAYRYFDMAGLSFDDLPYASILSLVLGKLDTAHHTAAEIDTLTQGKLGNLLFYANVFENDDIDVIRPQFVVSASALDANAEWLADLPREIMLETDFNDTARILDLLKQHKISMEQTFANAGHSCAAAHVKSYYAKAGVIREQLGNVGFYRFLCSLIESFDERAVALVDRLHDLAQRLFCDDNCLVSFAGDDAAFDRFWNAKPMCGRVRQDASSLIVPEPVIAREAFIVPSDVCFAGLGWDRRLLDAPNDGSWSVAARALSLDYLWNEVRVKGGAYGVGFKSTLLGGMRFYSYRDPHLDETLERFSQAVPWLAAFDPSREDMEGYIVSCVAGIDAPIKPRTLIRRQTGDYFCHRTPADRAEHRRQVIETDVQSVRDLAPTLQRAIEKRAMCVFGNREILESSKAGFDVIPLVG